MSQERELFELVKASDENDLPKGNGIYIVRNQDNSIYEMYFDKSSPTKFHYLNSARQKTENVIYSWKFIKEWLKPITFPDFEITVNPIVKSKPESISDSEGWIKVEDGLPEHKQLVHCYGIISLKSLEPKVYKVRFYKGDEFNKQEWIHGPLALHKVTHWMLLPAPPGEKSASLPTK